MIDPRYVPMPPEDPPPVPDGWVRVDFHSHTYGSGDAVTTVDELRSVLSAEPKPIDVLCVTDHNAVHVARAVAQSGDIPARIVVGEEIKTHEGELIGLFLTERISFGLPSIECARRIHGQGGVTYVPHPIGPRSHAMSEHAMLALLDAGELDAVEVFNARNPADAVNAAAARFATHIGLLGGAGSDAHYPDEFGAAYLLMPDFSGPDDFLAAMWQGRVVGRRHAGGRSSWRPRIIPPTVTG